MLRAGTPAPPTGLTAIGSAGATATVNFQAGPTVSSVLVELWSQAPAALVQSQAVSLTPTPGADGSGSWTFTGVNPDTYVFKVGAPLGWPRCACHA
jgi:hypothetical protein